MNQNWLYIIVIALMTLLLTDCSNYCQFRSGHGRYALKSKFDCEELLEPRTKWKSIGSIVDSLISKFKGRNYFYCEWEKLSISDSVTFYQYFSNFHANSESPIYTDNFIISRKGQLEYLRHGSYTFDQLKDIIVEITGDSSISLQQKIAQCMLINTKKTTDVW